MFAGEGLERRALLASPLPGRCSRLTYLREGRLRQDFAADLDAIDSALEIVAFGEGVGVDDRRIAQVC